MKVPVNNTKNVKEQWKIYGNFILQKMENGWCLYFIVCFYKKKSEIQEGEGEKIRVGAEKKNIWSARVVIRKMQISVRIRHLLFIRLTSDKKFYNIKFWKGVGLVI